MLANEYHWLRARRVLKLFEDDPFRNQKGSNTIDFVWQIAPLRFSYQKIDKFNALLALN